MKHIKITVIIITLAYIALFRESVMSQSPVTAWLDGVWEGTGYQVSNGGTWAIKFTGQSGTNNYSIEYPSLKCGGNWMMISGNEHRAEFVEVISFGTDFCVNGGIVVLTSVDERHIAFTYFSPERKLDAFSTLIKSN